MYIFSEDLLRLFDYLKLEKAGMSVKAFTSSALQFLSASHGRVSFLYVMTVPICYMCISSVMLQVIYM